MAKVLRERLNFGKVKTILDVPYLIEYQKRSFEEFLQKDVPPEKRENKGLQAAFKDVFPITDYNEMISLEFISYSIGEPKFTERECLDKGIDYSAPIKVKVRLNFWELDPSGKKVLRNSKEQEVFIGEIPLMTETGSFIINGTERVVVSQLHRSPGVFFSPDKTKTHTSGRPLFTARVIPSRGSWLDFEFDTKDILYVRIDKRKRLPATIVLKALGYSDEELLKIYYPVETIKIEKNGYFRILSDVLVGMRASDDIVDPRTGEIIVKEGSKITRYALKKMETAGIKKIKLSEREIIGRVTIKDIIDPDTGEVIVASNEEITQESFQQILRLGIDTLELLYIDNVNYLSSLRDTLLTDRVKTQEEALIEIYKRMRPGEPSTIEAARELFNGLFFDPKRYDLSPVGRVKINKRLGLDVPVSTTVLTDRDIIEIVRYLFMLRTGKGEVDDIDHLGNRRVRGVGELLENQFRIGLVRMERTIRERMSLTEVEELEPHDILNAK
ncbi:MAG: DNA-directed RNA polymerase subunit beta, partial [Thermodesulfovibrionales bacterium]|nr:DNA-directed RNA polymerase subunit beta [Thermodesulfovibrionales bacterium]